MTSAEDVELRRMLEKYINTPIFKPRYKLDRRTLGADPSKTFLYRNTPDWSSDLDVFNENLHKLGEGDDETFEINNDDVETETIISFEKIQQYVDKFEVKAGD